MPGRMSSITDTVYESERKRQQEHADDERERVRRMPHVGSVEKPAQDAAGDAPGFQGTKGTPGKPDDAKSPSDAENASDAKSTDTVKSAHRVTDPLLANSETPATAADAAAWRDEVLRLNAVASRRFRDRQIAADAVRDARSRLRDATKAYADSLDELREAINPTQLKLPLSEPTE